MKALPLLLLFYLLSTVVGVAAQAADHLTPITLQLKWQHAFQSAGFYAADIKGFYRDSGLKVTLKERLTKNSPVDLLMAGEAEYAVAGGSALLLAHLHNKPIKSLAVIFQHSPSILLSRKDSGIRTPADLVDRRVMRSRDLSTLEFDAMLIHEGVNPEAMDFVKPSWDINDLAKGRVDAMSAYITSGPFQLRALGIEPSFLQPITYGIDFYGDTLAATTDEIRNHSDRAKAFTRATLKGWQYAFSHQDEIIEYILTLPGVQKRGLTAESLRYEAREMEQLIQPKLVELGHINPGRFKHMADVLVRLKLTEPDYSLDGFIFDPNYSPQRKWLLILFGASVGVLVIGTICWFINRHLALTVAEKTRKYKESQQRFHNLITLLPEMVWESDLQGNLTYVNKAGLDYFNHESTSLDKKELNCLNMLIPEDRERAGENIKRILQGEVLGLNEYTALTGTGATFPVWIRSAPIIQDGAPVGLRGIIINISERKQLEDQLHQAQKMEAIGTLAGGIAHDFNNILTAVLGYTELANLHIDNEQKVKSDLEHVRKGALRARDLVSQILTFSRKSEKTTVVIEPAIIVKEALKLIRSSMPATIELEQHIEEQHKIQMDPTQFHQVLMNLCTNAIHAMEETGGRLTVSLNKIQFDSHHLGPETMLTAGLYVCLQVQDTGQGIDQATSEKIFDPYFTTKEQGKGTGLGLSVVHGIINEYKGDISLESEPGQGTTFSVCLPAITNPEQEQPQLSPKPGKEKPLDQGNGERIMIIDDEEELITMLTELLIHSGYRVCTYIDSRQALEHFSSNPNVYDLIITDMTMPGITGLELSNKFLALRPDLPIILMTGFSEQVDQAKAMAAGIKGFIRKPPTTGQFLQKIRGVLDERYTDPATIPHNKQEQ